MLRRLAFACTVLVLLPASGQAWNSVGHMAVAKIAYDQMEEGLKTKIFTLLKSHPHYDNFLAAGRPADVSEVEWVIVRCAIWSDWVRVRTKDFPRAAAVNKYHRGEDHYINIPLIDPKDEAFFAGKTLVDPDLMNVLGALRQRCNELRTATMSTEDRAVAVCWIFHLIGDIHQPLHNSTYFSSDPAFVRGDQGGNKFGVKVNGQGVKLHTYWDDLLGKDSDYNDDSPAHQTQIYKAAIAAAERLRGVSLTDADKDNIAKNVTFASWSDESFLLAKSVGYMKSDGSGLLEGVEVKFDQPVPDSAKEVGMDYDKRAHDTADVRVLMAGRRLADRVKVILK